MQKQKYREWLKEVARVRMLHVHKACQLSFTQRVVYSYLVWRQGRKTSQRYIARNTGLCPSRTLPAALKALQDLGLVDNSGTSWIALEPGERHSGWFVPARIGTVAQWQRKFGYTSVGIPVAGSPVTLRHSFVISVYHYLRENSKNRSIRALARMTGLHRDTCQQAKKLAADVNLDWFRPIQKQESDNSAVSCLDHLYNDLGQPRCLKVLTRPQRHQILLQLNDYCSEYVVQIAIQKKFKEWSREIRGPHRKEGVDNPFAFLKAKLQIELPIWRKSYIIERRGS